jgi:hypothetical protein
MITTAIEVIDIEESDELGRLLAELEPARGPVILRRGGRNIAVVSPLAPEKSGGVPAPRKQITEEDRTAARAALGGWAGNVDIDRLRDALRESRDLPNSATIEA